MNQEETVKLKRMDQYFHLCLIPEFNHYMYAYCRKHNVLHTEAFKHIIVQDVFEQYFNDRYKGGDSG